MNLWSFFMRKTKKKKKEKKKKEKELQTYRQGQDVNYVTGAGTDEPEEDELDLPDDTYDEKKEAK